MSVRVRWGGRELRVLDFDCESRPLSYLGQDFTTAEITAIACQFIGEPRSLKVWVLGEVEMPEMLDGFLAEYEAAGMVTGHNILRHDLPRLSAMLLEEGRSPLPAKLAQDTYRHLRRRQGVSASQESLADMLGVPAPKVPMSQKDWREANRLLPEGLVKTRARVVGDVRQHILLREELLKRRWLKAPTVWRP